jgi:hypothetical protein
MTIVEAIQWPRPLTAAPEHSSSRDVRGSRTRRMAQKNCARGSLSAGRGSSVERPLGQPVQPRGGIDEKLGCNSSRPLEIATVRDASYRVAVGHRASEKGQTLLTGFGNETFRSWFQLEGDCRDPRQNTARGPAAKLAPSSTCVSAAP